MMATEVARCQHTWTELLDLWPLGRESSVLEPSSATSERSSPSSEPLIDFKLRYLLLGDSRPRSRAY